MAETISRRGWTTPALIAMEVSRPFAFLLGQMVWVAQPALALLWSADAIGQVAALVESPAAWNSLHRALSGTGGEAVDE